MTVSQMTLEAIRSVPLFASLDDEAASDLRNLLSDRVVPQNTRLFRRGDTGDAMYLIESGRVRISIRDDDKQELTLAELAQGDFFGEMSIIDGRQRSADAQVIEDARLAVLSREAFLSFVRTNPDVALKMLSALTDRLRRTDELLRSRVSRNVNEEEKARLTLADRAADIIAEFGGSWKFILLSIALIVFWIVFNSYILVGGFDPKPYAMLNLVLAVIAGMQAPIIMMSQNRQGEKDRLRADLDYQVNLKNELSLAEVLRRLDVLESERLPKLLDDLKNTIQMIKAIFFDFNGVIIDDETIQMKAYQEILRGHQIDLIEEWYFESLGMDDRTFVKAMFERAKKPLTDPVLETVLDTKIDLHRQMIEDELPLFPGVPTFLKAASRHFSLGLVSMANKAEVGYVFQRANLTPLFSIVVTAEDASVCKPAPDCYLAGLKKLNEKRQQERKLPLLASECLAIEDSPPGIESARVAGMRTLGVTNTVPGEALRAAGAEVVTASLADWTVDAVKLVYS